MSDREILRLREAVASVDTDIVALVAQRLHLAELIGVEKKLANQALRQPEVEEQVEGRFIHECGARGISEELAQSLADSLIRESLRRQEAIRIPDAVPRRVLVVGGAGRMGRWLCRYFRSQGYPVTVNDVARPVEDFPFEPDLEKGVAEADVIVVSVPMTAAPPLLERIAGLGPRGLVFDICSIKAPVAGPLRAMGASGRRIASVHPMFGPDLYPISRGSILYSDCGNPAAVREAKDLFRATGAAAVDVPLDRHDELMAVLLGLSHVTLLAFARSATLSPALLPDPRGPEGSTYSRVAAVTADLLEDSAELVRDIQALNPHTPAVHRRLREALDDWRRASEGSDSKEFVTMLEHARAYFGGPRP